MRVLNTVTNVNGTCVGAGVWWCVYIITLLIG
jgi:hypothetical protein